MVLLQLLYNILPWLFSLFILAASCNLCSNDRSQDKGHLSKRQSLKRKQREAMLARKEVNSVVDNIDERMAATPACTCVRNMPDATTFSGGGLVAADVYRRLEEETSSKSPSKRAQKKGSRTLLEMEATQKSSPEADKSTKTKSDEMKTVSSSSKQKNTKLRIEDA